MTIPTFVGAGTLVVTEAGTIAPTLPAGTAVDDVAVMCAMTNASNAFPAVSGWTDLGVALQAAGLSVKYWWRRLDGGADDEPDAFTVASGTALSASNGLFGRIWVWGDCVTAGDPFEDVTVNGLPTNSATPTTLDIDTTGTDRMAVGIAAIDDDTAFSSGLPPATWTQAGTHATSGLGGDAGMVAIVQDVVAAGTVTGVVVGTLATTENWRTIAFALIGATGGANGTVQGDLPVLDGTVAGASSASGTAVSDLPALDGTVAAVAGSSGALAGDLPPLEGALAGAGIATGVIGEVLPALDGTFAASASDDGALVGDLPALAGELVGVVPVQGALAGDLPALEGQLAGTVVGGGIGQLLAMATTTVSIYAPAAGAPDEWSGARGTESLVATGIAASIIEQARTVNDPRTGTARAIRYVTGRVPDGTPVGPTSRLVDGESRVYAVSSVRQTRNPVWTGDIVLELVRTDQLAP